MKKVALLCNQHVDDDSCDDDSVEEEVSLCFYRREKVCSSIAISEVHVVCPWESVYDKIVYTCSHSNPESVKSITAYLHFVMFEKDENAPAQLYSLNEKYRIIT